MELREYVRKLKVEEAEAYIELDKEKEIAYMETLQYHFVKILSAIPDSPAPLRLLDIGTTPFTLFIKAKYPHYEVSTLDRTNLLAGRCESGGVRLESCNLDQDPFPFQDEHFDVVVFTEVLEHIFRPPTEVLTEARRVLRPGGKLILSVPNIAKLFNRLKLLVGVTPLPDPDDQMKGGWVHGHGHIHEYTMREITSLLEGCKFEISSRTFLNPSVIDGFRTPGSRGLVSLMRAVNNGMTFLVPSFAMTIYVECFKR